jgi:tetratricopeptide (TPR) repeat protein
MTEDNSSPQDIEELRRRWEAEPTPQLSLQLAEEYRRAGETEQAVSVLETALESHPEHVAARVALGRYQMELGRHGEARSVLEAVVAEDPTHLVANKALIHLYVRLGEEHQAQDRLDLYKILNEGDPEIEELELRIRGETPAEPADEMPSEPKPQAPVVMASGSHEPFAGLGMKVTAAEYWEAVGSEGIFPVAATAVATSLAVEPASEALIGEPFEEETAVDSAAEEAMATVTMAHLYLEQGHLTEAERTFREVLEREPDNQQAIEGLNTVLAQGSGPGDEEAEDQRITMLKSYLERLRSSAEGS